MQVGFLSYLAAVIAGAISLTSGMTLLGLVSGTSLGRLDAYLILFLSVTLWGAILALLPFLIAIAVMRLTGKVGWLAHVVAGTVTSYVAGIALGVMIGGSLQFWGLREIVANWSIVLSGSIAGYVYWWVRRKLLPAMEWQERGPY